MDKGNRKQKWRFLTENEIDVARKVFSDGIDYTRVKIYRGIPYAPPFKIAVSPNGNIYFPRYDCPNDFAKTEPRYQVWLIHELTHVWQYQHGYRTWFGGALLAVKGSYIKRSAYVYPRLDTIRSLSDLNMEQQADLIAHYYAARYLDWKKYAAELPLFEAVLKPFFDSPHNKSLLPKYRNNLKWFGWITDRS
ncbi:type IV secretion protein Rhs [Neisseria animaloris]|uniref:Type IV secretion protein Rhs n=1 Tax=Neisseria animaloris TaxID=326522 RepID=A0A3S4YQJ4_9NEIS|nr:type IV secretion protein Rhs [Neisseria animaloris]VEJ21030.1 Uncharacterised protein [Neisseria animaloris]